MTVIKIAIVGGGIAGLSAAIALKKYVEPVAQVDIHIYERLDLGDMHRHEGRKSDAVSVMPMVGAGLGLQHNGVHVLGELDPRIRAAVEYGGFQCTGFRFSTASDWLLGRINQPLIMISRGVLIDALRQAIPKEMLHYQSVSKIVVVPGDSPSILLEGEEKPEHIDLLIGADGIRSPTRHVLFGDDPKYQTEYSGSCAVGGFHKMHVPQRIIDDRTMNFVYGTTGFFGYSALSQNVRDKLLYWSVFASPLPAKTQPVDLNAIDDMLKARHGHWKSPIIQSILSSAKVDSVWPIFFVPPLPSWGRDGAVLIGDAAHAMTPRSGQGASQGIEDAQTLAILLAEQLKRCPSEEEAIRLTIDGLYQIRKDRVRTIHEQANTIKEPELPMSRMQTWFLYAAFFIMTKLSTFISIFPKPGNWDSRLAVEEYLRRISV
ncbi:FAD-binding domain-containing protein 30 [Elsinoe fawcettii]|nr:FAD-binding domain-containing protein 30 [Elsinoe fawcettii]